MTVKKTSGKMQKRGLRKMKKSDIVSALKKDYQACMLTVTQVRLALGLSDDKARELLAGLDYMEMTKGGTRRYYIEDVAERVMERMN